MGSGRLFGALASYDELARNYPDYADAHMGSAWIRATCPDAQYREGKLAVASATCACELTKWKDIGALGILAAACAQAGDFAQAVSLQQKVVAMTAPQDAKPYQERLDLYAEGIAYRETGALRPRLARTDRGNFSIEVYRFGHAASCDGDLWRAKIEEH